MPYIWKQCLRITDKMINNKKCDKLVAERLDSYKYLPNIIQPRIGLLFFLFKQYFISQTKKDKTAGVSLCNVFSWG